MAERKGNIGARENKALAQTKGERTKMQNKAAFGSRIREYRIKKGLSQPQLAALLGVTKNAVTNWEAGASRPDIASIPALCTHLGISADTFFDMPGAVPRVERRGSGAYGAVSPARPVPAAFGGRAHGCADRKRNARIPRAMRVSLYAHRARRAAGFGRYRHAAG